MPLLSVIIPVYNVQDYIGECFESIIMHFLLNKRYVCRKSWGLRNIR